MPRKPKENETNKDELLKKVEKKNTNSTKKSTKKNSVAKSAKGTSTKEITKSTSKKDSTKKDSKGTTKKTENKVPNLKTTKAKKSDIEISDAKPTTLKKTARKSSKTKEDISESSAKSSKVKKSATTIKSSKTKKADSVTTTKSSKTKKTDDETSKLKVSKSKKSNTKFNDSEVDETSKTSSSKSSKKATNKTSTKKSNKTTEEKKSKTTKSTTKKSTTSKVAKKTTTPKTKIEVLEYYDLPYRYNQTTVKILAQTPNTLFVYWDISDSDRQNLINQYGENFFEETKPVLIIHNETNKYSFEVDINDFANSWYLHISDSKCVYNIELGRKPINKNNQFTNYTNQNYFYVTSSNKLESPNDHILFNKLGDTVYFRNVKTNIIEGRKITSISFMQNIGKIYNIYDIYQKLYPTENIKYFDLDNPSSGNPSSFFK